MSSRTASRASCLSRGKFRPLVARYDQIESVAPGRVNLTTDESALELLPAE